MQDLLGLDPALHNRIQSLPEYTNVFVQRFPRYAIKNRNGGTWRTRWKPLADVAVLAHLEGLYYVGSLARWYPEFCIIDIDDREENEVSDIRASLGLDDANSMLCGSESADSYHVIFRPQLNGKPPTIRRLHTAMDGFAKEKHIELFPQQSGNVVRLPFGAYQPFLDIERTHITAWPDKLYWFQKLDEFDLATVEGTQLELPLVHGPEVKAQCNRRMFVSHWNEKAEYLLAHGLQSPSTRDAAQFTILYHFYRSNVDLDTAIKTTWKWIQSKNNGFSKDFQRYPEEVKKHIQHQAATIYSKYDLAAVYPDSTHNHHNGFICRPDLEDIIRIAGGNIPKAKFLFHLVKHSYPRCHRNFINVHSDKLISWSSHRTYKKYLEELDSKGIVRRGRAYFKGEFSKDLKLNWHYRSDKDAVLYTGRSLDTFSGTLRLVYNKPPDLKELFTAAGTLPDTARKAIKRIYEGDEKAENM